MLSVAFYNVTPRVIMLSVVMLSVIMLNVVAPVLRLTKIHNLQLVYLKLILGAILQFFAAEQQK